jgi:hypothetical protein
MPHPPPNPLAGDPADFGDADWFELVKSLSPGTITTSDRDGDATLVGVIDFIQIPGAARYFLGYMLADGANTDSLRRQHPILHPYAGGVGFKRAGVSGAQERGMPWYRVSADFSPLAPKIDTGTVKKNGPT